VALSLRIGNRFIHPFAGDAADEPCGVLEATPRYPLLLGTLVSGRNRVDFRLI